MLENIIAIVFGCCLAVNDLTREHVCQTEGQTPVNVCCAHFFEDSRGQCIECAIGTTSEIGGNCFPCAEPFYGNQCLYECQCTSNEKCHHELGCIPSITTTTGCPDGALFNGNGNCVPCGQPFYGRHCKNRCECSGTETCDNVKGCILLETTTSQETISKTTPEVSHGNGFFGLNLYDKTGYYIALACVFVMAVLIGILLKRIKSKQCSRPKSPIHVFKEQNQQPVSADVISLNHEYEYIDELRLVRNDSSVQHPIVLESAVKNIVQRVTIRTNTTETPETEEENKDSGQLNPHQTKNKIVDVHATDKCVISQSPPGDEEDYLNPYHSLLKENEIDVYRYL